jgi:hypothetical protein
MKRLVKALALTGGLRRASLHAGRLFLFIRLSVEHVTAAGGSGTESRQSEKNLFHNRFGGAMPEKHHRYPGVEYSGTISGRGGNKIYPRCNYFSNFYFFYFVRSNPTSPGMAFWPSGN